MKEFFFTGRNPKNVSGLSWKIWKIVQKGRVVTAWWGPAKVVERKVCHTALLLSKAWKFRTEELAKDNADSRIAQKIREGYERKPRRKSS